MNDFAQHKQQERSDRRKSALITFLATLLLFLVIFFYKFTRNIPVEEKVNTILINFSENKAGEQTDTPSNQDNSKSVEHQPSEVKNISKPVEKSNPNTIKNKEKNIVKDKILTGKNKVTVSKAKKEKANNKKNEKTNKSSSKPHKPDNKKNDIKEDGAAAIGNLIKRRRQKIGSQTPDKDNGTAGDPLGGDSSGHSVIGSDRKLIAFIPGTMGKGGSQPTHNCTASGTITIAYTVNKAGNVISASRASGVSDACVVSTSIGWVKLYVKAERSQSSSTGVYKITF